MANEIEISLKTKAPAGSVDEWQTWAEAYLGQMLKQAEDSLAYVRAVADIARNVTPNTDIKHISKQVDEAFNAHCEELLDERHLCGMAERIFGSVSNVIRQERDRRILESQQDMTPMPGHLARFSVEQFKAIKHGFIIELEDGRATAACFDYMCKSVRGEAFKKSVASRLWRLMNSGSYNDTPFDDELNEWLGKYIDNIGYRYHWSRPREVSIEYQYFLSQWGTWNATWKTLEWTGVRDHFLAGNAKEKLTRFMKALEGFSTWVASDEAVNSVKDKCDILDEEAVAQAVRHINALKKCIKAAMNARQAREPMGLVSGRSRQNMLTVDHSDIDELIDSLESQTAIVERVERDFAMVNFSGRTMIVPAAALNLLESDAVGRHKVARSKKRGER